MAKLPKTVTRVIGIVVTVAVVGGVVYFAFLRPSAMKTVTAHVTEAVGIYQGTPVDILGIPVGDVTSVKPEGDHVTVTMEYDATYKLPNNVSAVMVANSLVSDRYIQLAPVYRGGPAFPNGGLIPVSRTSAPAELDDIYAALNKLSVALGPAGANKGGPAHGPLSTLLNVSAANLRGNGTPLGNSITQLSRAAQTLANGRNDLFGTVHHLQDFTKALADSDKQVRLFNAQLAQVAADLASERGDLGKALHDLAIALDEVNSFIKNNANRFHTSITGLESITGTLVKEKASLNETLAVAPVALANIVHAYQPNIGAIATRGNMASLTDFSPQTTCALLYTTIHSAGSAGNVLGPLTKTINKVCKKALGSDPAKAIQKILGDLTSGQVKDIGKEIKNLLGNGSGGGGGGGLGGLIGAGGS